MAEVAKPHVVCVPYPLQGHIIPMLKLAKLLHHKGFHVTFVNSEINHKRMLESRGPNALDGLPDFRFETMPIEHLPSNSNTSLAFNLSALYWACGKKIVSPFRDLIAKLNDTSSSSNPPVTCILVDFYLNYTVEVSEELGIPNVLLCVLGASGFMSYKHYCDQTKQCHTLLRDPSNQTQEILKSIMQWIPGMKGAKLSDLAKLMGAGDQNDSGSGDIERAIKASAVIFHTFEALESEVLNDISSMFHRVYSIGPLQLLLNQISDKYYDSNGCNLWIEEPDCMKWLNSKEPNSVIYVSFGSVTVMTVEQVIELAWGLANSNYNFLWIIRPDLIMGDSMVLPQEFLHETRERGLVASWCPQEQVLNHPSIGGFITQSGWNSIVESISAGIPMICWPFFAEQFENCRKSCNEWGFGLELSSDFKRDEIERLVKELMIGEKGKKMKKKVIEWKKMAKEAASSTGSSTLNLDNLVNEVLLSHS